MPRARQGSAYVKHGKVVVQVRLRDDAPRRFWVSECPPRANGAVVDVVYARSVAADLQRAYDAGRWDPLAPKVEAVKVETPAPLPPPTVKAFADVWAERQTYESASKDRKVLAKYLGAAALGAMAVRDLRPLHIAAFIDWLKVQPSTRGGTIAARTVRNVYDALRRALDEAVLHEVLPANPCAPVHGRLPSIEDKVAGARDGWFFPRAEVWALLTDARVIEPRRVVYAVEFLTGCRPGELSALRLRDWDRSQRPLTRLTLTRAIKSCSKTEGTTKTGARKFVPVHPALERILTEWVASGWRRLMGRDPMPDDLLCPNQNGDPRNTNRANRDFGRDLAKLELRPRHHYVTRHTFITQTQEDGGDPATLRWITHAPPKSSYDGYTRAQWARLCAELVKLRVGVEATEAVEGGGGSGGGLTPGLTPETPADAAKPLESAALSESGREDLNRADGVSHGRHVSHSGEFPGVHVGASETDGGTAGRLTPRLTPPGVVGCARGEAYAYHLLEFEELRAAST